MRWMLPLTMLAMMACADGGDTDVADTDTTGGDTGAVPDDPIDAIVALTGDATAGETLYGQNCQACHGADGTGGVGSDLTATVPTMTDREVVEVIVNGKGSMAGFGGSLEDQEIADITAYVVDSFGG